MSKRVFRRRKRNSKSSMRVLVMALVCVLLVLAGWALYQRFSTKAVPAQHADNPASQITAPLPLPADVPAQ